jgi:hypothetical protein
MAMSPLSVKDYYNQLKNICGFSSPSGDFIKSVSLDCARATYRFAATFTPYATGALTVLSIKGSASATVRIRRLALQGVSTAAGSSNYVLQRVSALGASGTAVNPTAAKNDPSSVAATAVVAHYTTAAQTNGTAVGGPSSAFVLGTSIVTIPTTGPVEPLLVFPEYGTPIGQALVLRGVADFFEVQNKNASNLPAGTVLSYVVELEEDLS